jgi:hypothetical protein
MHHVAKRRFYEFCSLTYIKHRALNFDEEEIYDTELNLKLLDTWMEGITFIYDGFSLLVFYLLSSSGNFYSQEWDKEISCTQRTKLFLGGKIFLFTEKLRAKGSFIQIIKSSNLFCDLEIINLPNTCWFFVCLIRRRHMFNSRAVFVEFIMDEVVRDRILSPNTAV